MEPITLVIDGEQVTVVVQALEPDRIQLLLGDREAEMSRRVLRRLMYQLAAGHTAALRMESALIGGQLDA